MTRIIMVMVRQVVRRLNSVASGMDSPRDSITKREVVQAVSWAQHASTAKYFDT